MTNLTALLPGVCGAEVLIEPSFCFQQKAVEKSCLFRVGFMRATALDLRRKRGRRLKYS